MYCKLQFYYHPDAIDVFIARRQGFYFFSDCVAGPNKNPQSRKASVKFAGADHISKIQEQK
jgi:hypothetical protein